MMNNAVISTFLFFVAFGFSQQKPNILIIHTDDLGYHDLSFTGSQLYNTNNIDQLAMESVSFTNAYSSYPRCTPSRYAMMTRCSNQLLWVEYNGLYLIVNFPLK